MGAQGFDPNTYKGKSFRAVLSGLISWVNRDRIVVSPGSGLRVSQSTHGRMLTAAGASPMTLAQLPVGGIAAGATGTVTVYEDYNTLGSTTLTVRNPWDSDTTDNLKCAIGRMVGVQDLAVLWWDCEEA